MPKLKKYSSKDLTNHLRSLAAEAETVLDDGTCLTKGEALAHLLWKKALGYTVTDKTDEGVVVDKVVEPATWAIQLVYERLEGKAPQAITEDENRLKVAERVSDLSKARLNALAPKAAAGPPAFKRDE